MLLAKQEKKLEFDILIRQGVINISTFSSFHLILFPVKPAEVGRPEETSNQHKVELVWQRNQLEVDDLQDRTGQNRTGQNRTEQDRTEQNRTGQNRTGQDSQWESI